MRFKAKRRAVITPETLEIFVTGGEGGQEVTEKFASGARTSFKEES